MTTIPIYDDPAVRKAAVAAIKAFRLWRDADGMFPDPEYDDFLKAMYGLSVLLPELPKDELL